MADKIALNYVKYNALLIQMGKSAKTLKDDEADSVPTDGMHGMDGVDKLLSLYEKTGELVSVLSQLAQKDQKRFNEIALNFVLTDSKLAQIMR